MNNAKRSFSVVLAVATGCVFLPGIARANAPTVPEWATITIGVMWLLLFVYTAWQDPRSAGGSSRNLKDREQDGEQR